LDEIQLFLLKKNSHQGPNKFQKTHLLDKQLQRKIEALYTTWANEKVTAIEELPQSGSDRVYFRIRSARKQALAAYNQSAKENKTFVGYTHHFRKKGVKLPQIYAEDLANDLYLLQDLGDTTLLQFLQANRTSTTVPKIVVEKYKKALAQLAFMQIEASKGLPIEEYQQPANFDRQNMLWDLNYFKYCFLKACKIEIDEQQLEEDFGTLVDYLSAEDFEHFMFRDFQSRNIMLQGDELFFIDYQGGKYGPLQYDVVSLLFQAKANLPNNLRNRLLDYYIQEAQKYSTIDVQSFREKYFGFVLIRTLQVLGAYGFKGFYERKAHFLASIPFALRNLDWWLQHIELPIKIPYLRKVLTKMVRQELPKHQVKMKAEQLTVRVQSFSYKRGIPKDPSGNGGGFVFDCRFIHNPGRYAAYKKLTGRDAAVIEFFRKETKIEEFVQQAQQIIDKAVENYTKRQFASLCINFGCTGGQHRSVFCADYIAKYLESTYPVRVELHHREQERKNWKN